MPNTKILFWNCRGVTWRRPELLHFIQEHNIDILLLNETHLSHNTSFKLPNYHSYYTNKKKIPGRPASGGTAILVNKRLIRHSISIQTISVTNTTIHIQLGNSELRLTAIYKRPNDILHTTDLDTLFNSDYPTIVAGDLNCKHRSWHSSGDH